MGCRAPARPPDAAWDIFLISTAGSFATIRHLLDPMM
jgi:hypothetical protein